MGIVPGYIAINATHPYTSGRVSCDCEHTFCGNARRFSRFFQWHVAYQTALLVYHADAIAIGTDPYFSTVILGHSKYHIWSITLVDKIVLPLPGFI